MSDEGSVSDLDEVVNFDAASDAGLADAGAVDAGVGLDFDVIFDNDRGGLRNFVPVSLGGFGESEAICADDDAVLKKDVVADAAVLAHRGARVSEEVFADFHSRIDHHVRQEDGVRADFDILSDDDEGTDMGIRADAHGFVDDGCWMHARRIVRRLVEEFESLGEGEVGIFRAEHGGGDDGEVLADDDGGSLGGLGS